MKTDVLTLFIVDDNTLVSAGLRNHLNNRFGNEVSITTFLTGRSALEQVSETTNMVILDYMLDGENGNDILKSIKLKSPKTEVIMLSSNNEMEVAIRSFRNGASDYVIKGSKSWKKITSIVFNTLTYPIRIMVKEFGIGKYLAVFIFTFVVMGVGVLIALKYVK